MPSLDQVDIPAVYRRLGVQPVINAAGPATRLGGLSLDPRVVDAMGDASRSCVRMEELHRRAGAVVAEAVGTESALVTCGAGAGLVLAVAAAMTGYDVAAANSLPERGTRPYEVIMLRAQRYPYDHLLGVVGAEIVDVGYYEWTYVYDIEAAITDRTAAFLYYPSQPSPSPPLHDIVEACHRRGVPVIVDAALEATPPILDRRWVSAGVDAIVFSGGKRLGGPQASGVLCGRKELVEPAMLQMLDMDVREQTWVERGMMVDGLVQGPPRHGLGRAMKVGKEEIAGLVEAVRIFQTDDHLDRATGDTARLELIAEALEGRPGIRAVMSEATAFAPTLAIVVDEAEAGFDVWALLFHLQERETPVHLNEARAWRGSAVVDPRSLRPGEELVVRAALEEAFETLAAGT